MTETGYKVETLPPPRRRVNVSVYTIRDETGQHKPNDLFAEYSRAVTQAGGPILLDVLKRAGEGSWFRVLERVTLNDIVKEREIIDLKRKVDLARRYDGETELPPVTDIPTPEEVRRARREAADAKQEFENLRVQLETKKVEYAKKPITDEVRALRDRFLAAKRRYDKAAAELSVVSSDKVAPDYAEQRVLVRAKRQLALMQTERQIAALSGAQVRPVIPARYTIAGAIVGYDSNEKTGGLGARFLGIGGDTKYRRDVVTINLRLIDPLSSEVLLSVTSTKTIYAIALQGGAYRFVSANKILELEGGVTRNELSSLAVRHAMELGVFSLIAKGVQEGIWRFRDKEVGAAVLEHYDKMYSRWKPGRSTDATGL